MKRFRFNLLLCLVVAFVLAACRSGDDPIPTPEPTVTVTPAAARGEETSGEESATAASRTPVAGVETTGETGILYSVPFEVRPDGFGFRNYGANFPEGDFTIVDLRAQFGDGVCSRIEADGDICIPTAEAQQWIDDRNADMSYGHCIGFTVASYRFAQGELEPDMFAPTADVPFDIDRDIPIMRTIAANGSLYWAESVWSSEVSGTPRDIVDALVELGEPVDLSIFLPGLVGGHSLLAYGVERVDPQTYHILVYDNNYPGEEAFVEVDYEANTWRYDQGAVTADQTAVPYEGDATTETLRFIPLSSYDSVTCPFCLEDAESEEAGDGITLLSFLGQGDVLVETALGAIGWVAGEIVNEIPGARFIFQRGQLAATDTPDIVLPAGIDYTVQFNSLSRVSSLSRDQSLVLDQLTPVTEESVLAVTPSTQGINFKAGGEQSPLLRVTVRQEDTTFRVALLGVDFAGGQSLAIGAAEQEGGLVITSPDAEVAGATLLITRLTEEDEALFATTSLDVAEGGSVALDVAAWDGSGSMDVYVDENGDGSYDEQPTQLSNEPLSQVIQQSEATEIAGVVDNLSPYLGEGGLEEILAGLAEQELSGREIGEILQPLGLMDEQLIDLIAGYDLPIPELAELLYALRLEPERLDAVIGGLELEDEDETALRDFLDDLALYHEIINEWEFLNTDDLAQLAALLNEYDLTAEQLAQLLSRMGLSTAEIEEVLRDLDLTASDMDSLAEQLDVSVPPTRTPTATPTATATGTITTTVTPASSGTATPTATLSGTTTVEAVGTPDGTPTPNPYPGALPPPTGTPGSYPYPGPLPRPTGSPGPYPGPSATPDYESEAFCNADNLVVIAGEPTWVEGTIIEIWAGEGLLYTGEIGPEDESLVVTFPGPGTWEDLRIEASEEPDRILLGTITCTED